MKKLVIIYGLICGLVVITPMLVLTNTATKSGSFEGAMLLGYATMVLAFSLVFVGIRNYRNKYNDGIIGFGKAFKVGILIVLIASTVYVIGWLVDYYLFLPDFPDKYAAYEIEKLRAAGASQASIDKQVKEMAEFKEMYKNPVIVVLFTYLEILPVGLIVTLISALVLKRKQAVVAA